MVSNRQFVFSFFSICCAFVCSAASVVTQHNDQYRRGANLQEVALTPSNVNSSQFGKLFSLKVDGQVYAQPLYVPGLSFPGKGVHNTLFVATEHNSVYAFDADSPSITAPLWQFSAGTPILCAQIQACNRDIVPEIGITSTPVIDVPNQTIFVVAETYTNGVTAFNLHALDLLSGAEKPNSPVLIQGSVPGTGAGSANGVLAFDPYMHWQRAGLLLLNGSVFIGFGSHQDTEPYHGWIFSYKSASLAPVAVRCLSPNGDSAGVWQGGVGIVADDNGNLYVQTGHGAMDGFNNDDFGISMVKLKSSDLSVIDYFSPLNEAALSDDDNDFGSSGPLLIPGTSYVVGGGKDGKLFLVDTNNMGQFNSASNNVLQWWQATYSLLQTGSGGIFGGNAWYNNTLYMWGRRDYLKAFQFSGQQFQTLPASQSPMYVPDGYSSEPSLSVSANGTTPGTAILWTAGPQYGASDGHSYPGILRAFDATDVSKELWNSEQNTTRDYSGSWAKWVPPTVVNGKVYLATFDNVVNVYGLLPSNAELLGNLGAVTSSNGNLSVEGNADWIHFGDTVPNRKANVTPILTGYNVITNGTGGVFSYNNDPRPLSWNDGSGSQSATGNTNGVAIGGIRQGFTLTVPADSTPRTITVHCGGYQSRGAFTAHISDGSSPDFTDVSPRAYGQYDRDYTITYAAKSSNQTLTISWLKVTFAGNITLSSVALSTGSISLAAVTPTMDLTQEGPTDWVHIGPAGTNRKLITNPFISGISSGEGFSSYNNDQRALTWSDGFPSQTGYGDTTGMWVGGKGQRFSFTVPADPITRTVTIHAGGWYSSGQLLAILSDGSAANFVDTTPLIAGQFDHDYVLNYRSAIPGQTLNVQWIQMDGTGNVTFDGVAVK